MTSNYQLKLLDLCRVHDYEAIREFFTLSCAEERALRNQFMHTRFDFKTPLHYVCSDPLAPTDIIELLISIAGISVWSLDENGNTCLHEICSRGHLNSEILQVLLQAAAADAFSSKYSKKKAGQFLCSQNVHGCTAIHFLVGEEFHDVHLVGLMLRICPDLAYISDNDGDTVLHWAVQDGIISADMIRILLQYCPETVFMQNLKGELPIDSLWQWFQEEHFDAAQCILAGNYDESLKFEEVSSLWEITEVLLQVAYHKKIIDVTLTGESEWRPLHAASGIDVYPIFAFFLAFSLHPEGLREQDEAGRLPVHVSASTKAHKHSIEIIECLLIAWPDSATMKDKNGKTPLCLAIESGLTYSAIDRLLDAAPGLLSTKDAQTNLYPFMLAMTSNLDDMSLTLSYKLLLKDPSVVDNHELI
eukprot:CAMPEP_0196819864 /NCGR_PEP_ID=MMETSP1362-20130617/72603_1 /TAXON_ID=163516 /ORGANISM="Leptocylindrus danicus, Strain CCMP1856" /LENGTH=416 /DNA_ID=CAMNT_0042198507 /DNA_START=298 /DNA_END=1548 /DNA_ORIENTATION=+